MEDQGKNTTFAVVESLSGWWELAGVVSAVHDNTANLLARDTVDASPAMPTLTNTEKKQAELPAGNSACFFSVLVRVGIAGDASTVSRASRFAVLSCTAETTPASSHQPDSDSTTANVVFFP